MSPIDVIMRALSEIVGEGIDIRYRPHASNLWMISRADQTAAVTLGTGETFGEALSNALVNATNERMAAFCRALEIA